MRLFGVHKIRKGYEMKRILLTILLLTQLQAFASNKLIDKAIYLTTTIPEDRVLKVLEGDNSDHQKIEVDFINLTTLDPAFIKISAVTGTDENDKPHIYIDDKYKNSPPEAIACLLEHETTHNTSKVTKEQEIRAWKNEAKAWEYFITKNPELTKINDALVKRLNHLVKIYKTPGAIEEIINSNSFYGNL